MHNEIFIVLVSDGALPRALEPGKIMMKPILFFKGTETHTFQKQTRWIIYILQNSLPSPYHSLFGKKKGAKRKEIGGE